MNLRSCHTSIGLRRTTKKQGSNSVTFVWDGSDYLKEYS